MAGDGNGLRARLRWLERLGQDADRVALLEQGLIQAMGALHEPLGGMAHLDGPGGRLRLVAAVGIPGEFAPGWEGLDRGSGAAPSRAVTLGEVVWSGDRPEGSPEVGGKRAGGLAVPLTGADGAPVGALTVLMDAPPAPGEMETAEKALRALAESVGDRLPRARRSLTGEKPWTPRKRISLSRGGRANQVEVEGVGTWDWDLKTGLLSFDPTTVELLKLAGLHPGKWGHHIEEWMSRIHEDDLPLVDAAIGRCYTGKDKLFAVAYRVVDQRDKVHYLELRGEFVRNADKTPVMMKGTAWNVSRAQAESSWLANLWGSHPEPLYLMRDDDGIEWANTAGRELMEQAGGEEFLHGQGLPELLARVRAVPGSTGNRTLRVERGGDGSGDSWFSGRVAEVDGLVSVQFRDVTARVREEQAKAEHAARMEALNSALIKAVGTADVFAAVAEQVLPMLGASGLVMHDLTGPEPRMVGLSGHCASFADELAAVPWADRLEAGALAQGAPLYVASVSDLADRHPRLLPLAHSGGMQAWAAVPLIVSDQAVGAAVFTWTAPRRFTADDRTVLGTIGIGTAGALASAAATDEALRRADQLAGLLLPRRLPETVAADSAVRYLTGSRGASGPGVSGHGYGLLPLPGGRVLGMVAGVVTSPDEAYTMGSLRQTILTLARLDMPLDEVIAHMRRQLHDDEASGVTATCLLVVYDPTDGRCLLASAGHAAPVVMRPGQEPTVLDMPVGQALGAGSAPVEVLELTLPEGTVLALAAGASLHGSSGSHLAAAVARQQHRAPLPAPGADRDRWLDRLCDTATGELPSGHDELVLLALATRRLPQEAIAEWTLDRVAESAAEARTAAAGVLSTWNLEKLTFDVEAAVSELVGNAVLHGGGLGVSSGDRDHIPGTIRLRMLHLGAEMVVCELYDGSKAAPQMRLARDTEEFGRGLAIVANLTDNQVGTRYTEDGKIVWAAFGA